MLASLMLFSDTSLLCFQIPNHVAIKIALELKKLLIDNSLLDVYVISIHCIGFCKLHLRSILMSLSVFNFSCSSQSDLEANLFKVW